jgi:hypothetical protein
MKHQKLTTYLATGIALIASSAAPSYGASLTTGAALLSGTPNQPITQILSTILADPTVINNPGQFGFSGDLDVDQQPNGTGSIISTVNNTLSKPSGTTLTGSALAKATLTTSDFSLGSEATATLNNLGGADPLSGAVSGSLLADTLNITSTDPNTPNGSAGSLILTLDISGTTSQTGAAQALGAAAVTSGTNNYLTQTFTGNTTLTTTAIPFVYGDTFNLDIALGSLVAISGNIPIPISSGQALFGNTLKIGDIQLKNSSGDLVSLNQVNIIGSEGTNYKAIIGAVTSVPEPSSTLGIFAFGALGAGWTLKRKQYKKATTVSR